MLFGPLREVAALFGDCIMLCTESTDTDPLTREGAPNAHIQSLMRELKVCSVCCLLFALRNALLFVGQLLIACRCVVVGCVCCICACTAGVRKVRVCG